MRKNIMSPKPKFKTKWKILFLSLTVFVSLVLPKLYSFAQESILSKREAVMAKLQEQFLKTDPEKNTREEFFAKKTQNLKGVSVVGFLGTDTNSSTPETIADTKIYFHITNNTDKKMPLLKIPTGIKKGTLNYIRLEGATGYEWDNGQLVLAYVSLYPNSATDVVVTGLPLISPDQLNINISPKVKDQNGKVLFSGETLVKTVKGKRKDILDNLKMVQFKDSKVETSSSTAPVK